MDGPWVSNLLEPHNVGNSLGTVTLTTTAQILCPTNMLPNLANWFNYTLAFIDRIDLRIFSTQKD